MNFPFPRLHCSLLLASACCLSLTGVASAENRAPAWVKKGAYVYRISTPDADNVLPHLEAGVEVTSNLFDGSITQIPILNGIIGHDHPGACNWDGVWPYWNRVTFRANHSWKDLSESMERMRTDSNVRCSFHLNLTDGDVGLRDYDETRAFFDKLVKAKAIYRRDWNGTTGRFDLGEPYVPQAVPAKDNPIEIFALVNYQNFWKSGLAKEMIDEFYGHLPYAPPILYLDVLNLSGGNFSTGFPDGPLGGSEVSQREGAIAIINHLRSKGTDLATEGPRPEFGERAGYVWLHGPGFSSDDYRVIAGGNWQLAAQQVLGNAGAFNLSPIAVTAEGVREAREHYAALVAGRPTTLPVASDATWHIAYRADIHDKYDIPGTGDPFRGHWADLVSNFYLASMQELYHIGNGSTRVKSEVKSGWVHLGKYSLVDATDAAIVVSVPDFVTSWQGEGARKTGQIMLETPIETKAKLTAAGRYSLRVQYKSHSREPASLNVYVDGKLFKSLDDIPNSPNDDRFSELTIGEVDLAAGEHAIAFDIGPMRATWSDGTNAEWTTPYLRRGLRITNGDLVFADDFDRMWPDTWSGQTKIYFFSWQGAERAWKLPNEWQKMKTVTLHALTPDGRAPGVRLNVADGSIRPRLLPQVPYIAVPSSESH